jgi:glutamate dehydrogenase
MNSSKDTGNKANLNNGLPEWESLETLEIFEADSGMEGEGRKRGDELELYVTDIAESVRVAMDQSISILTPWFFSNLPQFYYQTTPRSEKVRDLHAVITGHIFESKQKLQLWNREKTKTTILGPGNEEGIFRDIAARVQDLNIKNGYAFTSNDGLLLIASFFTDSYRPVDLANPKNLEKISRAKEILADEKRDEVEDFLYRLDDDTVIHATPNRLCRLFKIFQAARHREDVFSHVIPNYFQNYARFDFAFKKMPVAQTMQNTLSLFHRYGFHVARFMMTVVNQHAEPLGIMTAILQHESQSPITHQMVPFLKMNKAIKTLKWVDSDAFDALLLPSESGQITYSLNEINLIRAASDWVQIFLAKHNPYYYSEERVRKTYGKYADLLNRMVHYFRKRFDPRLIDLAAAGTIRSEVLERIADLDNRIEHDIMTETLNFFSHILKTNYFYARKTGLSFRMDPGCLNAAHYPNRPFGFFYFVGRGYRGFHVRFRDIARGGLRIIRPADQSQYEVGFVGLFDEVIGLAYAQQLKNKDIPEGGAKAVLLLRPGADREMAAVGAVDSLLNLITTQPPSGKLDSAIVDYHGREEYIYLGPDENVTNELIDKFVDLARSQGYRFADAFMSSKPGAGINHKEFGVTSEGINVFLDNMLSELGIDPKARSFTVKITGGPDGDVAGNELRILHREYGEQARVVAIGDGFGAAHDPAGLHWPELLRLVKEGLAINHFAEKHLSGHPEAFVITANSPEKVKVRNGLYARVPADIFIPAGGRPYTVNADNWQHFLQGDGTPSARAVVEGANIFFTDDARERLQEKGLLMFKDSSANKCGVICSSFEILAALIISPDEFLAIKRVYVEQVLQKLRAKADSEAKLLLREYHERGRRTNLVQLSKILSAVINRVTDLVSDHLAGQEEETAKQAIFEKLILDYAPAVLAEQYRDRLLSQIPSSYRRALISADIAARLVYREGISWLEHLPDAAVVQTVQVYLEQEHRLSEILEEVAASGLPARETILKILHMSGTRTLTQLERMKGQG